jgi:ribosome-associated protein
MIAKNFWSLLMILPFELEEEYIELYKLLKVLDLVDSGGEAKMLIAEGHVLRNGEVETRKRAKIEAGETIQVADVIIEVE